MTERKLANLLERGRTLFSKKDNIKKQVASLSMDESPEEKTERKLAILLKIGGTLFFKKNNIKKQVVSLSIDEELLDKKEDRIFFEKKENYEKCHEIYLSEMNSIYKLIDELENDKLIYQKQMEQYKKYIERNKEKIKLDKLPNEEYSEKATRIYLDIVERDYIKILDSVMRRVKLNGDLLYMKLGTTMKKYLETLNIFEKNIEIEEGKYLTDEAYSYMNISATLSKDSVLSGKIKEIERMPYVTKFMNEDEVVEDYVIRGKVTIYK